MARLIQKVYKVDPLECTHCGANLHIIALSDEADVIERILKHLEIWDPPPETISPAGPCLPKTIRHSLVFNNLKNNTK